MKLGSAVLMARSEMQIWPVQIFSFQYCLHLKFNLLDIWIRENEKKTEKLYLLDKYLKPDNEDIL